MTGQLRRIKVAGNEVGFNIASRPSSFSALLYLIENKACLNKNETPENWLQIIAGWMEGEREGGLVAQLRMGGRKGGGGKKELVGWS